MFSKRIFNVCSNWTQTKLDAPLFCLMICRKYDNIFFSRKKLWDYKTMLILIYMLSDYKLRTRKLMIRSDLPISEFQLCILMFQLTDFDYFPIQLYFSPTRNINISGGPRKDDFLGDSNQTNYDFETFSYFSLEPSNYNYLFMFIIKIMNLKLS